VFETSTTKLINDLDRASIAYPNLLVGYYEGVHKGSGKDSGSQKKQAVNQ